MTPSTAQSERKAIEARSQQSQWINVGFVWLTRLMAFGVAAVLIFIGIEVAIDAVPAIQRYGLSFITTSAWNPVEDNYGALPMIYGTLVSSFIALLLAVPIGVGTAIFLSEDFLPKPIRTVLAFMVELLAAIPSVVYGLWGIFVLSPFLGQ
jgi:phosphate transport system permease protein